MIGSRRRNRREPTFDTKLPVAAADVVHHEAAHAPTEVVHAVQDTVTLVADREPEPEPEVAPEPEPLPHAGYAIGPQILAEHPDWRWLFPFPPAAEDTSRYGWVDVSIATREVVEEFLGGDLMSWVGKDAIIRTPGGGTVTAHDGDRIQRDEDGLRVECTRAFENWETGSFQAVDAAIAAGDGT